MFPMQNTTPRIIAITGPTSAGKTTLGHYLSQSFDAEFSHIRQDDYLKDPSTYPVKDGHKVWDLPENVQFDVLVSHLVRLKDWEPVNWRTFAKDESDPVYHYSIQPKPFIILEGTMILMHEKVRELADMKAYLDVPLEVALARRKSRALNEWNMDLGEEDSQIMTPVINKHREVQKFFTDYIVDGTKPKKAVADEVKALVTTLIKPNENTSLDPSYVSGVWDQSNRAEPFPSDPKVR